MFSISVISLNVLSQNSLHSNDDYRLVGSWKMVSTKVTSPEGDVVSNYTDKEKRMIKMFSKTQVVFVRSDVATNTVEVAGSAQYSLEGNTLTQITGQHSANFLVGEKYQLNVSFPGDNSWILKGNVGMNSFEEKYVRID
jgi:hypothetical protein